MSSKLQHRIRKAQTRLKEGAQSGKTFGQIFQGGDECEFILYRALGGLFDNGALSREQMPGWSEKNELDMQKQRRNYRIYRMALDNTTPTEIAHSLQVGTDSVFSVLRTLKKHGLFEPCIETLGEEEEDEDEDEGSLGDFPDKRGWWREHNYHPLLASSFGGGIRL